MHEYTPWLKGITDGGPILGDFLSSYVNREDVRDALNIPVEVQAWEECSTNPDWHYYPQQEASYWIYTVLRNQIKIMFYSGDTDGALPTAGSR